jgi:RNA polymerase sigma factor (sigma-70 family)
MSVRFIPSPCATLAIRIKPKKSPRLVFVVLARKAGQLRRHVILEGWLYQTARLTSVTFLRSEIRQARRQHEACMQTGSNDDDAEIWAEIAPLLDKAMAGLNQADRHAVVLRFFYGKTMKEVGLAMDSNEGAVRVRLHRALEKLRAYFLKRGITSTTESIAGALSAHSVQAAPLAAVKVISAIAAAKGATAAASTLALVKGSLQVMAWTKAKSVMAIGAVILLATVAGVGLFEKIQGDWFGAGPDIEGVWEGIALLDLPGVNSPDTAATSHVVLKIVKAKNGYTATSDWPEMGKKDWPMEKVTYNYPSLQLERTPSETWTLKVNPGGTQMVWDHSRHYIQPDPVMFFRTTKPDETPARLEEEEFATRDKSSLQGYWKGEFTMGSNSDPVNIKIAEQPDGTYRGEAEGPMDGVIGMPLSVSYEPPLVKFVDAIGHGLFQGSLTNANSEMIGSFTAGGKSMPARLVRADYHSEHAHDSEKDYTFSSENDLQGHWKGSWVVTIANTKATIRLALDIAKLADGSYATTLSDVDNLDADAPIPPTEFQWDLPDLRMKWRWKGAAYEGALKNGKIVGSWIQGGGGFPLVFERSK